MNQTSGKLVVISGPSGVGKSTIARKVLRRLLEHEQEHLAQLRALLERYRQA